MMTEKQKQQWAEVKQKFTEAIQTIPNPETTGQRQIEYQEVVTESYRLLEKIKGLIDRPTMD